MKLKAAVIGIGYFGKHYIRILSEHPDIELVVACDKNIDALQKIKNQYPNVLVDFDVDDDIQIVFVATPVKTHFSVVKQLLKDRKNVLCEKVFTETDQQARELINLSERNNVKLAVGHTYRHNPHVQHIKQLIDNNELGEILYFSFDRIGISPLRDDVNSLADLSGHDIDMLLYWLGEMPKSVVSFGKSYLQPNIEDVCFTNLEFSNNVIANLRCSWYSPKKIRTVTIVGRNKMLLFDDVAKTITIYENGKEWVHEISKAEPLTEQVNDFISCIKENKTPKVTGEDGLRVVQVLQAAEQSLKNNSQKIML